MEIPPLPIHETRHIIRAAIEEAKRMYHTRLGTIHVLLGFVVHGRNSVAQTLTQHYNLSIEELRAGAKEVCHFGTPTTQAPKVSANLANAFNLASRRNMDQPIQPEDLLYGIITVPKSKAVTLLENWGVNPEELLKVATLYRETVST